MYAVETGVYLSESIVTVTIGFGPLNDVIEGFGFIGNGILIFLL